MRHFTFPGVVSFALLGCTVNTYSTPRPPSWGFGMQSAPAGAVGYASGGEAPVASAPRVARPSHAHETVARAPRPSASSASAPRFHEATSAARDTHASASRADAAQSSSASANASNESAQPSGSSKSSSEAGKPSSVAAKRSNAAAKPSTGVASQPAGSVKRPQVARPTGGVVMLARSRSTGSKARDAADPSTTRAKPKAKTARGTVPVRRRAPESSRAFAALGAAPSPKRDRSDEQAVLRQDAGGTMQLAKSERSEHVHSADETESLAAQ